MQFDNKMKSLAIDFFKAGAVMTGAIFVISLIIYLFEGIELRTVFIITALIFFIFYVFGVTFLLQQKVMTFHHSTVEIMSILKRKTKVINLSDIKEVKIIHIGNYQPKIVIKTHVWRYVINCINTTPNQSIINIKTYFKSKKIPTKYKDHGIRW